VVASSFNQIPTADGGCFFVDASYKAGYLLCRAGRGRQGRIILAAQREFLGRGCVRAYGAQGGSCDKCQLFDLEMLGKPLQNAKLQGREAERVA
jgi:hypothetical protein